MYKRELGTRRLTYLENEQGHREIIRNATVVNLLINGYIMVDGDGDAVRLWAYALTGKALTYLAAKPTT